MRRIAVVTGTRAEWGLLSPVCDAIAARGDLSLEICAGGAHLLAPRQPDLGQPGMRFFGNMPLVINRAPEAETAAPIALPPLHCQANIIERREMQEHVGDLP